MKHLEYKIVISAPAKKVWETMLQEETYRQWSGKGWPDSFYEGKWVKGEQIRFIGPDGSGTLVEIVDLKPYERVFARHIAILRPGGVEDRTSDEAKNWVGMTEEYKFTEHLGKTTVTVLMEIFPEWAKMLDDGWPNALEELKKIAEQQKAAV